MPGDANLARVGWGWVLSCSSSSSRVLVKKSERKTYKGIWDLPVDIESEHSAYVQAHLRPVHALPPSPVPTLVRYQLPVVVIVFNNGGVYGGDRRSPDEINGPYKDDPAPTSFVPSAAYHTVMEAFGGNGYLAGTPDKLKSALAESFAARKPAVINVIIDPYAGSESGRLQHKS